LRALRILQNSSPQSGEVSVILVSVQRGRPLLYGSAHSRCSPARWVTLHPSSVLGASCRISALHVEPSPKLLLLLRHTFFCRNSDRRWRVCTRGPCLPCCSKTWGEFGERTLPSAGSFSLSMRASFGHRC